MEINHVRPSIARVVKEVVVADNGDIPAAPAVDVFCFSARREAAWTAPVDLEPDPGHRLCHFQFHLIVGCLQVITEAMSRADIGTEMNPCLRGRHESRPALDKGIEAQVTEFMAA